jgi:hypothetical protein
MNDSEERDVGRRKLPGRPASRRGRAEVQAVVLVGDGAKRPMRPCSGRWSPSVTAESSAVSRRPRRSCCNSPNRGSKVMASPLVSEARVAGDNKQCLETGQCCRDFLHHAVGEEFLLRIAAQVLKRQHDYGRLVRE